MEDKHRQVKLHILSHSPQHILYKISKLIYYNLVINILQKKKKKNRYEYHKLNKFKNI